MLLLGFGSLVLGLVVMAFCVPRVRTFFSGQALSTAAYRGAGVSAADLIITGGDVRTMNPAAPRAQAVAIAGNRIIAVGSNAEVSALAGPGTRRIDAGGATVMPGIIDSHNHVRLGANPQAVQLFGAESLEEIRSRIAVHLQAHPDIDWIEGEGWNYQAVPGGRPTAAMIDDVCGGRPAWLFSYDVHTVWLNSEGLRRWGASPEQPVLPFGNAEVDEEGRLTGWVHDFAVMGIHPRGQGPWSRSCRATTRTPSTAGW